MVPPTSKFIGKTARELRLRKQNGISLLAINRDKKVIRENVRDEKLRAGDMLVFHSIWQDLGQAAESRDFVVVTDYPKGEQRPHKFKIAMTIFAITILIALTSKLPVALTLMTGVAGMLLTGVLRMDEAYGAINWKTVFLMADEEFVHVSSSLLKQIAPLADDEMLARFVPRSIIPALRANIQRQA